jgi:glycosyltransferase involved in cell wall biosynthesis
VGDGPSRQALEALRQLLRLGLNVSFLGKIDDVGPYLEKATLFVQPATEDDVPLTMIEAMSAGVPIVANDVGRMREVVENGVTGTLVEPGNPTTLAEALQALLKDRSMLLAMSRSARARAERGFDARQMATAYETLYLDTVAHTPRRAVASAPVVSGSLFGR